MTPVKSLSGTVLACLAWAGAAVLLLVPEVEAVRADTTLGVTLLLAVLTVPGDPTTRVTATMYFTGRGTHPLEVC